MAEPVTLLKGTRKKKEVSASRSFLHCGGTPLSEVNNGRLSLMSNARLQRITSSSLERLSVISDKEIGSNSDYENYHLEYSTYLLRKAQSRLLTKNKGEKEEKVKKCFISLKLELEELLEKYVKLSKGIGYYKLFLEIVKDCNNMIETGNNVLVMLKENNYERLMMSLSSLLEHTINQLQLVDIDKNSIEEAFNKGSWGMGSEIHECLKKIDACTTKNKTQVSNIATELVEIKKLSLENSLLRERYCALFNKFSTDILETNYTLFTDVIRKAFEKRQECKSVHEFEFDIPEFLLFGFKPENAQSSLQLSNFDSPYQVRPKSASTPQPD